MGASASSIPAKPRELPFWCAPLLRGVKIRAPWMRYSGMALWPFILLKRNGPYEDRLIRHERIHLAQQLELLIVPFYIAYLANYLWLRVARGMPHDKAYRNIIFEREAYACEHIPGYLTRRRLWQWAKQF